MNDNVKVRISGQFKVSYFGIVEIKRELYEKLNKAWEDQEDGIDADILLDIADALRSGDSEDFECDQFELVQP